MTAPRIPGHVLRFLEESIDSVPQLEALLLMFDEPQQRWSVPDISARTYISHAEADKLLERLARRNLVHSADGGAHFAIQIGDAAMRALLEDVARTYRANLTQVATFIHEKPPASVKEFARAFDLKRNH
jgi:hypothetical protein